MTEAFRNELGAAIYQTLTRGLSYPHPDWLEERQKSRYYFETMITPEGVDALRAMSPEELDDLSFIGPSKAKKIHAALERVSSPAAALSPNPSRSSSNSGRM